MKYSRPVITDDMVIKFSYPKLVSICEQLNINPEKDKVGIKRKQISTSSARQLEKMLLINCVIDQYNAINIDSTEKCVIKINGKEFETNVKVLKFIKALFINTTNPNEEYAQVMFDYASILVERACLKKDTKFSVYMPLEYTEFQRLLSKEIVEFYLEEIL